MLPLPKAYLPDNNTIFFCLILSKTLKNNRLHIFGIVNSRKIIIIHSPKVNKMLQLRKSYKFKGIIKRNFCFFPEINPKKKILDLSMYPMILRPLFQIIHSSHYNEAIQDAWNKLLYYELATLRSLVQKKTKKIPQKPLDCYNLPFQLTEEQQKCWYEIKKDLTGPYSTRRLLYGEVGSGKTALIFLAAQHSYFNNRRVVILVPNVLLVHQLYNRFKEWNDTLEIETITAKTKQSKIQAKIIIGTHALFFRDLLEINLLIIDEQQKFGVLQRQKLLKASTDLLMITATPIPRTLSMLEEEYLQVSYMTKRRGIIYTKIYDDKRRNELLEKMYIYGQKHLVLWVINNVEMATNFHNKIQQYIDSILIYGNCKNKTELLNIINKKNNGIVVSTTVMEVGVDCSFEAVVIENADCLGYSQLHQIRGRVARKEGSIGYCILLGKNKQKLRAIKKASTGFAISKLDLKKRGGGNFLFLEQSGDNFSFAKHIDGIKITNRAITQEDIKRSNEIVLTEDIKRFFSQFTTLQY